MRPVLLARRGSGSKVASAGGGGGGGIAKTGYDAIVPNGYEPTADPGSHYESLWMGWYANREVVIDRLVNDEIYAAFMWQPDASWPVGPNAGETWLNYSGSGGFYGQDTRSYQGQWGRIWNFHNSAGETGGAGWNYAPGNSASAMDFINGNLSWNLDDNAVNNYMIVPWSEMVLGHRYTIAIHKVMGRVNGADGTRQGQLQVWVDGVQKLNLTNVNTIWRFTQPTVVIQRYYLMWAGFYTRNMKAGYQVKFKAAYPFVGNTIAAMKAHAAGGEGGCSHISDQPYAPGQSLAGPASASLLSPSWTSGDMILPSGW